MTQYSRPAICEYTCDCAEIGKYRWVKERGEYHCPFCGRRLREERVVHKRVEWDWRLYVSSRSIKE